MLVREEDLIIQALAAQRSLMRTLISADAASHCALVLSIAQMKPFVVFADQGPSAIGRVGGIPGVMVPTATHLMDGWRWLDLLHLLTGRQIRQI